MGCRWIWLTRYCVHNKVMFELMMTAECLQVEQQYLITNMTAQHAVLLAVIQEHMRADQEFKVMCFFTTARITQFYCALFNALGVPVLEMHSRKSQAQRTRAADQFRAAKRVIMFSSDVSARGVDYPDVSMVIQVSFLPPLLCVIFTKWVSEKLQAKQKRPWYCTCEQCITLSQIQCLYAMPQGACVCRLVWSSVKLVVSPSILLCPTEHALSSVFLQGQHGNEGCRPYTGGAGDRQGAVHPQAGAHGARGQEREGDAAAGRL